MLDEREKTHGPYETTARISQNLKDVLRSGPNWTTLRDTQAESLEMIMGKVARILSGNAGFADHWDDIIGYAQLARREDTSDAARAMDLIKAINS
jgi:hypothetical protein